MLKTVDHFISSSLKEYLNYKCLTDLRAFTTVTGDFFQYSPKWAGKSALGSSYAGWVYDNSIAGATIPTYLPGVSGAIPDYRNGRFIIPTGINYTGIKAVFSVNEVNFYISSSSESKLIFETKYQQNPDRKSATSYFPPDSVVAPCVFIKNFNSKNKEHCFGGEVQSIFNFKLIAMAKSESQLLGIQKIIRDSYSEIFPLLDESVLDQYNNLRSPTWNYEDQLSVVDDYCFIENATFQIQETDLFTDDNPHLFVGVGNIDVCYYSNPRMTPPTDVFFLQLENNILGEIGFLQLEDNSYIKITL